MQHGKDVIDATTIFAQAGYEAKDALDLGEQAIMLKNVSEAGATAEGSANTLIAAMKAFGLEASNSTHIVDALNEVSNKYAVSVNDLSTGITKASASMAAGNNTLEETFGLVAAGTEILRQPGRVANGLSTITARLTADNDEYIASITGGMGVIDKNTGELRSTFDVLQDLSKAWSNLTSVEKQELTEVVAGKTQRSLFTALMSNFSTAVGATEAALNSEGSALEENNKRMDSLNGRLTQLQSAWQSFARNTINSEVVKSLLSLGTTLLKLADTDIGRLILTITALRVAMGFLNTKGIAPLVVSLKTNLVSAIASVIVSFKAGSLSGGVFGGVLNVVGVSAKTAATGVGTLVSTLSPLLLAFAAVGAVYAGYRVATEMLGSSMEDLATKTDDSIKAYEESASKVKDYESQIKSLNEQIDKLNNKGKLSLTEEQDLENLKKEKSYLEANLKLEQDIAKAKKETAQQNIINQLSSTSGDISEFFKTSEIEAATKKAKKALKEANNEIYKSLTYSGENIDLEVQDMAKAYAALGDEIQKSSDKISKSSDISQKDAEKEKEKLQHLKDAQAGLSAQMKNTIPTLVEWYKQLEGGGETAEKYRNIILAMIGDIDKSLGTDFVETLTNTEEVVDTLSENIDDAQESYNNYKSALDDNIDSMINYGEQLDILNTAMEEIKNTGGITAETFKNLSDNNLLQYLEDVNGKLSINEQGFIDSTNSLKENAIANLQASTAEQVRGIVLEDIQKQQNGANAATDNASSKLSNLKQWAIDTGKELINFAGNAQQLKISLQGLAGSVYYEPSEDAQAKINNVLENAKKTYDFINKWKPSTSKAATTSRSSGSKKKSSTSTKEEYKAEIDTLYQYENALDNAKDEVDRLKDALGDTDSYEEQERYIKQLIAALNNQIAKTQELKNAQSGQIQDYINQLRAQGFAIDYNAEKNELYINNMQHLADFSGDTAKSIEKIIKKIQDLNSNNRTLDGSVRDLTGSVKDYYDQLADIPEKKLEKFNDLMKEFQQSQLDTVQDQIDNLKREMEKDPRLAALEKEIEALEKQNDTIDKQKEMEEKLLAVEEARQKLQNAMTQKTLQVYREGQGWVYEVDPDKVKEAQDELKDAQDALNEQIKDDKLDKLKEEQEAIKKSYQDQIDNLESFLDDQNYIIDKANREGIQSFEDLRKKLAEFGLDSAENLKKASDWLNQYNDALSKLNQTATTALNNSTAATNGLIYSSATQNRINQALSGMNIDTTITSAPIVQYDKLDKGTGGQNIYIDTIELPNVSNANEFVEALKDLPRLATTQSSSRK